MVCELRRFGDPENNFWGRPNDIRSDRPPIGERSKMTVCIAATCRMASADPQLILCTDWKTSSALGSAETHFKQRILRPDGTWHALTSGTESDILPLIQCLKNEFNKDGIRVDDTNITGLIRNAILNRKKEKSDEYIISRFGMTYDDFVAIGKSKFPDDLFRSTITRIGDIQINAELVVAGFNGSFPVLCETNQRGEVKIREDFAVAGEGGYLATAVLLHRKHGELNEI